MGGDLLRPDGRCDQACFSASPLAPIGVTMLHLACERSQGRERNPSSGRGSVYECELKVEATNYVIEGIFPPFAQLVRFGHLKALNLTFNFEI